MTESDTLRAPGTRTVVIDPVTRVEGHGKVTLHLDAENRITEARLHIVEFRGFERFIQGRPYWEMPVAVQRLCGICPVSHHLCAAKALDRIVGVDRLTVTAEKMRRLMHHGQFFQSHALHFFYLASPDLLMGFDADPVERNVLGVAARHPELARQGIRMRKWGQEIIRATAGRRIHGTGAVPGGINRNLSEQDRDALLAERDDVLSWTLGGLKIARQYTLDHLPELREMGSFPSAFMSLVRADGALDLYDGGLRVIDAEGRPLLDHADVQTYHELLAEEVRPWSYMKFPFLRSLGPTNGWYRVGPLARMNACDFIDTPLADEARRDFMALGEGRPVQLSMAYHWARMVEALHSVEKIGQLLEDPDLQGQELMATGARRPEGVGAIEAPRGTLFHHYQVDDDGLVTRCNLIVSTTHNNEAMNRAVRDVAQQVMDGHAVVTEAMMNRIEVVIRAYDPCLSCATHALGQMPLVVEAHGHDGSLMDRLVKSSQPNAERRGK